MSNYSVGITNYNLSGNPILDQVKFHVPSEIKYFGGIFYTIMIFGGTLGNILAIVVIRSTHAMHTSRDVFTALALADCIVLWINPFRYWIILLFGFDLRKTNDLTCKLQTFATYAARDWATNVLCLLTFERFLFACFPHKSRIYWKIKRKLTVWFVVLFVIILKNLPFLIKLEIMVETRRLCDTSDKVFRNVFFYVDIAVYSIVPTILLLVFNTGLLRVLHRAQRHRMSLTGNISYQHRVNNRLQKRNIKVRHPPLNSMDRSVNQANRLLIPVTIFHLLTSLPFCIFSIIEDKYNLKQIADPKVARITFSLGYTLTMLSTSSHGVNFLIYFLSSRVFRSRLWNIICPQRRPRDQPRNLELQTRQTPQDAVAASTSQTVNKSIQSNSPLDSVNRYGNSTKPH